MPVSTFERIFPRASTAIQFLMLIGCRFNELLTLYW